MVTPARWEAALWRVLATVAGAALFLGGLVAAGHSAREQIAAHERYFTLFHTIKCTAPPGRSASEFLDEVRYLAELPERLNVLDASLSDRLTEAFGRHPLVSEVRRIRITPPGEIHVELRFRSPESASVMRAVSRLR